MFCCHYKLICVIVSHYEKLMTDSHYSGIIICLYWGRPHNSVPGDIAQNLCSYLFWRILSVTMNVAGEYQKILTEDKGLGAGIHWGHRPRWIPAPDPFWGENFLVFTCNTHCDDFILWGKSVVNELMLN